jgi:hypothetical protein
MKWFVSEQKKYLRTYEYLPHIIMIVWMFFEGFIGISMLLLTSSLFPEKKNKRKKLRNCGNVSSL